MTNYSQGYYQRNKEKIKQQVLSWRNSNKEKFLAYQRAKQKEYRKIFPLRKLYQNIKQRCEYPQDKKFQYYGGKGIKCLITSEELRFLWDRDKAILMKQPSIDRIDASKDYCLSNCKFIEMTDNRIKRQIK